MNPNDGLSLFGLALGLSMDAFAVAVMASAMLEKITRRHLFRLAFHFGLFQALMPLIGWAAGRSLTSVIQEWDHWVAFGLLLSIGTRAIVCSFKKEQASIPGGDPTRGISLVALSVATSIDALAVGVTFAVLGAEILVAVLIIGIVATTMTTAGMLLGKRLGDAFGKKAEFVGGIVLVAIGVKILIQDIIVG